jgi:hypothetical protein
VKFSFREPDADESAPQRVLVWSTGATTDVKVVILTGGALAVFAASLATALTEHGVLRAVATAVGIASGLYSGVLVFGLLVAFGVNRLVGSGDDDD